MSASVSQIIFVYDAFSVKTNRLHYNQHNGLIGWRFHTLTVHSMIWFVFYFEWMMTKHFHNIIFHFNEIKCGSVRKKKRIFLNLAHSKSLAANLNIWWLNLLNNLFRSTKILLTLHNIEMSIFLIGVIVVCDEYQGRTISPVNLLMTEISFASKELNYATCWTTENNPTSCLSRQSKQGFVKEKPWGYKIIRCTQHSSLVLL